MQRSTLEADFQRVIQPIQNPMHREIKHNEGCIMIDDENTPEYDFPHQQEVMAHSPMISVETPLRIDKSPPVEETIPISGPSMVLVEEPQRIPMITTRLDTRRDLADTGVTISVTGIRSILHRFQADSDYEIKGYDGQVTKAAGQGYARIYNPISKFVDEMLFVYTPLMMGTINSLEYHARTHPRIHKWTQEATPSDDKGLITFYVNDRNGGLGISNHSESRIILHSGPELYYSSALTYTIYSNGKHW
jgi:hypothetical protein